MAADLIGGLPIIIGRLIGAVIDRLIGRLIGISRTLQQIQMDFEINTCVYTNIVPMIHNKAHLLTKLIFLILGQKYIILTENPEVLKNLVKSIQLALLTSIKRIDLVILN